MATDTSARGDLTQAPMPAPEPILEPELPIVDAHHHLFDRPGNRYLFPDLLADIGSGHRIEATVYIEATAMYRSDGPEQLRCVGETEFANGVAAMSASGLYGSSRACAAIVAYADCHLGAAVEEVIHAHFAAAPERLRGVRIHAHWDPEFNLGPKRKLPDTLRLPAFREGFARIAPLGLSCDVLVFQTQLMDLAELAQAFPETRIIVNHVGMPLGAGRFSGRQQEQLEVVRRGVQRLAGCPNVWMKVGGLGMKEIGLGLWGRTPAATSEQVAAAYRPYVELCLQTFGPSRCMFESNFPVDRPSASYAVLWNAFKRLASSYSASEKRELFAGTARRAYRLNPQPR